MTTVTDYSGAASSHNTVRLVVVIACLGLSLLAFYLAGSWFFYKNYTGMIGGVFSYIGDIGAAIASIFTGENTSAKFLGLINFAPVMTVAFFVGMIGRVFVWNATDGQREASANLLTDQQFRGIFFELLLMTLITVFVWWLIGNTVTNLHARKIASGFDFLNTTAGFGIIQSLISYSETDTYGRAIAVGLVNTIYVSVIGIFFATILGFIVGVMRLSHNWIISKIASVYVEVLRNIPLLLQIIVWYTILLSFVPDKRDRLSLFGIADINKTGIWTPAFVPQEGFWMTVVAFLIAVVAVVFLSRWAHKRQDKTGQAFPVFWTSVGLLIGLPLLVYLFSGMPGSIDYPVFKSEGPIFKRGFEAGTGHVFIPEFLALLFALALYTAAFIAEIVRAGILAVNYGQTEAASALGLRRGKVLRLVVIPQALRVIIPPLTSQYLNLTKNSSLAMAIAYPDLVANGGIVLNQTGQAVEIIVLWMAIYLTLSIITSVFMNWYNARMALVER